MAQQSALRIKRNSPIIPRTWRYLRRKWHVTLAPFPSAVIKFYTHDKTLQLKLETLWEFWKYVCNDAGTWDLLITSIFCVISSASISSTIYCHKKRNHFSSFVCPPVNRASCFRCAWLRAFKAVTLFHYFEHLRISIFDDLNIPQTPKSSANSATSAHPRELRDNVVDANNKFFYTQQQSQAVQYRCMSVSIGIEVTGITKEQHGKKNDGAWAFAGKLEQWREGRRERWRRVERKGVTECNDNARFMQPCTAEETRKCRSQLFPAPTLRGAASRCSCCNAVAVGCKPRRKETSRIASPARSFVRWSLSAEMHRCLRENFGLVPVLRKLLLSSKDQRNRGDCEVTQVEGR